MSPYPRFAGILSPHRVRQYRDLLVGTLLVSSQSWLCFRSVIAMPSAGTVIENQATGSYQNDSPETQTNQSIESDKVTFTVAEVAGITAISAGVSEAVMTVNNAGIYQGDGNINAGDIVYYDYLITNVGNDPTQFFIPDAPANVSSGGTFDRASNPIQVTAYNLTGTNVSPTALTIVPAGGQRTGPTAATATTGGLLGKNGIIPAGGSVTIRVPIKIDSTATAGQLVSVTMGNTSPNTNTATQNQVYLNNNNQDIYTQDNPDGTTNAANLVVETAGEPINGDSTSNGNTTNNHRQEASAVAEASVVLPLQGFKSVKLTVDADHSATISAGDTLTWTVTYLNNGSNSITNFQITDLLPPNVTMTSTGAQTIAINTIQGATPPTKNAGYTGLGIAGASSNNLLNSPTTLVPGGVITVSIPVKINSGTSGTISNQSIATGTGLIADGVKTDNVDRTTTNLPAGVTVPVDSVLQTQNNSIDPTTAIVLTNRAYVVSPDRDKIIINEVLYSQSGTNNIASNDEFIELYNASAVSVDLSGWKLIDGNLIGTNAAANDAAGSITGSAAPFVFGNPLGSGVTTMGTPILQPGQYAVIWIGAAGSTTTQITGTLPTFQAWLGNSPKLNDSGDDIWLYDSQTRIVDYVTYGANNATSTAINTPPLAALNLWDSSYASLLTASKGQSISLTPNGRTSPHTSACWESTTSGAASPRCPGALPTRDTDLFATTATTTVPSIQRQTSVGVNNNGSTTSPSMILVKRITGINQNPINPNDGKVLNTFIDDAGDTNDTHVNWPSPVNSYPVGQTNGGLVKPADEVEYTIYFLSAGDTTANNVLLCDRVPANVTFNPNAFTNTTTNPGGLARGIAVQLGSTLDYYTNTGDSDLAQYFPPGIEPITAYPKANCGGSNSNGAVVVNLGNRPQAIGDRAVDAAAGAYGFVRFRGLVK